MDKTMLDILKERLVEGLSIKSVKETNAKYTIRFEFEGDEAKADLFSYVRSGDSVLLKASHGMALGRMLEP